MPFTIGSGQNPIPPGTYSGTLESVEVDSISSSFGTKDMRRWHFLIDVNGVLLPVSALSSLNTAPGSKSYQWLKAILRRELLSGEAIEDPVGQRMLVVVENNAKGYAKVVNVLPFTEPEQLMAGVPR